MVSSRGVLSEGEKRERWWVLIGGWCECECDGVFHQQLSMSAHPPVPRPENTLYVLLGANDCE